MQLEQITASIDKAFGEPPPLSDGGLAGKELLELERLLHDEGCQQFLQDQVSRQIIRDYLTNAVVLGFITLDSLDRFADPLASREGRSALSLQMLMSSVEEAGKLPDFPLEPLQPLQPSVPPLSLVPK